MTLSLTEIDAVVAELATALAGAVLVGADPLPGPALLMRFVAQGQTRRVLVSARPHCSRIHLTNHAFDPDQGERASAQDREFADRLRRELRGGTVTSVRRVLGDRVVRIDLAAGDRTRVMLFECSGQHPNLFLCDDRSVILAMLATSKSQRRDLRPGSRYARPLKHEHDNVETQRFLGGAGDSVSASIEEFYDSEEAREDRARSATAVRAALRTALVHQEKLAEAIAGDLAKAREAVDAANSSPAVADVPGTTGAPLADEERGASPEDEESGAIDLGEAFGETADGSAVAVPGEQALPAREIWANRPAPSGAVEWQERRLADARAAADRVRALIAGLRDGDAAGLEAARRFIDESAARSVALRQAALAQGGDRGPEPSGGPRGERPSAVRPAPGTAAALPVGVRRFRAEDGTPIWVAANAIVAPRLTFEAARDDDIWLRVDGGTGAHVVVACGNREPAFATLVDAGLLAVHFSRLDPRSDQPVQVARRRDLRPAGREAPPDEVRVGRSRMFTIRPDAIRVARVLATEGRGAARVGPGRALPGRPAPARPGSGRPFEGPRGPRPSLPTDDRAAASRDGGRPPRPGTGRPGPGRDEKPRGGGPARTGVGGERPVRSGPAGEGRPMRPGPGRPPAGRDDRPVRKAYGPPAGARDDRPVRQAYGPPAGAREDRPSRQGPGRPPAGRPAPGRPPRDGGEAPRSAPRPPRSAAPVEAPRATRKGQRRYPPGVRKPDPK